MIDLKKIVSALAIFLFAAGGLFAEWTVSPVDSRIGFTAMSRMHDVDGLFKSWEFQGKVNDDWSGKGKVVIQTASIDTENGKRDKHLRGADFFDVQKHPEAIYTIEKMSAKGDQVRLDGKFTLLGVTKPLAVELKKSEKNGQVQLEGDTTIHRGEFGMNYSSMMNPIKDEVKLHFRIAVKKK